MRMIGGFLLVLTVVAVFAMAAPIVTGDGAGVIRVGNAELRLVFHVAKSVEIDSAEGKTVQLQVDLRLPYSIDFVVVQVRNFLLSCTSRIMGRPRPSVAPTVSDSPLCVQSP